MLRPINDLTKSLEYVAWQHAKEKRSLVQEQIGELKEDELAAQLRSIAADPENLNDRAAAFLDGGIESINHRDHLAERLEQLREQIAIVERAAELQDRAVDKAHADYSALACRKEFRPKYAEAARKVVAAIAQLAAAFEAENAVTDEIRAADVVRLDIPTVRAPILGHFRDREWVRQYIDGIKKAYPEI